MMRKKAGQVRGELGPWPQWAAECAGDHRAVDELVDSASHDLWTVEGSAYFPVAADQLTCDPLGQTADSAIWSKPAWAGKRSNLFFSEGALSSFSI